MPQNTSQCTKMTHMAHTVNFQALVQRRDFLWRYWATQELIIEDRSITSDIASGIRLTRKHAEKAALAAIHKRRTSITADVWDIFHDTTNEPVSVHS